MMTDEQLRVMPIDKAFAAICGWLKRHGYTAHTFNAYRGARGPSWTELRDKATDRFIRRL